MLTAWNLSEETKLALPDFEEAGIVQLRELTRAALIVCPVCREPLWLRAGEQRRAHFAHRILANRPQAHTSATIIETRWLLYKFFQDRIRGGKLAGSIELEPVVPELPEGISVDLILRRDAKPSVAILLLETAMKPAARVAAPAAIEATGSIFRPVFLSATLKRMDEPMNAYALNPTHRDFKHESPFGIVDNSLWHASLHFMNPESLRWTSLRGLRLIHSPQVFQTTSVHESAVNDLLWSESQAEWTHLGEPRVKLRSSEGVSSPQLPISSLAPTPLRKNALQPAHSLKPEVTFQAPAWISNGLVCIGCRVRTDKWQTAMPAADSCVCKECFAKGVR